MGLKIFITKGWLAIFVLLTAITTNAELTTMALKAEAMETIWITVEAPAPIATPTAPMHPSYTDTSILKKDMLQVTNNYRKKHDARPLTWNDTLAEYSKKWADACIWKHSVSNSINLMTYKTKTLTRSIARRIWREPSIRLPEPLRCCHRMGRRRKILRLRPANRLC